MLSVLNKLYDGKRLSPWQNAKSQIITLQGTNGPWQKEKVVYFHKFSFLQVQTKFSTTKHYSLQCPGKSLFTLQYPWQSFQRMRLLSAKAKYNYQKQTTSCPDRKHLLLQISTLNYALKAYIRQHKSKRLYRRQKPRAQTQSKGKGSLFSQVFFFSGSNKIFNDKALFTTIPRQITIHATVPMAKFSKNAATFGKSKIQLSKADN